MLGHCATKLFFILIICCITLSNGTEYYTKVVPHNSWLYQFKARPKVAFDNARASCFALGGDLVTPKTDEELEFLKNEMKSINDKIKLGVMFNNGYWIGLEADITGKKPVWKWIDGTKLVDNDENKNWIEGQPDQPKIENCATMIYTPNDKVTGSYEGVEFFGKWNDKNCLTKFGYICKYKEAATLNPFKTAGAPKTESSGNSYRLYIILIAIALLIVAIIIYFKYFNN